LYPHRFFAQQEKGPEPRIELGPDFQKADALPTELQRTPENNCWRWNWLFDADFSFFILTGVFCCISGGIFSREGLSRLWNQLVRDGELVDETLFKQR
jgi:hypothetical protein